MTQDAYQIREKALAALQMLSSPDGMRPIWIAVLREDVMKYMKHLEAAHARCTNSCKNKGFKMEEEIGTLYTHYLCPYCNDEVVVEGDTKGEEIECDECEKKFIGG